MSEDINISEKIDRYLEGNMSAQEHAAFENKIDGDPSLAEKVEEMRYTNEALHYAHLSVLKEEIGEDLKNIKYRPRKRLYRTLTISALVLSLGGGIGVFLYESSEPEKEQISPPLHEFDDTVSQEENKPITIQPEKNPEKDSQEEKTSANDTSEPKRTVTTSAVPDHAPAVNNRQTDKQGNADDNESITEDTTTQQQYVAADSANSTQTDTARQQTDLTPDPVMPTCDQSFTIDTSPSCKDEATGTIEVLLSEDKTYTIEVDGRKKQHYNGEFEDISPGDHAVTIHYGDGCTFDKSVTVPEKWCSMNKSYSFNPDYGEKWEIRYEKGAEGTFTIYNAMRKEIYRSNFGAGGESWDGTDVNGNIAPVGNYIAIINYNDGRKEKVNLTIVR